MKKAIWILFVILALIWTGGAYLAAGLARWTSDAIASVRVVQASERWTQQLTGATGRATQHLAAAAAQSLDSIAAVEEPLPVEHSAGAATEPTFPTDVMPPLPPLPEWVNEWMPAETVQSIKDWGDWAKRAANDGKVAVADAAHSTALAAKEAGSTRVSDLSATRTNHSSAEAGRPWLARIVGWLVPLVWVIWGVGLVLGFVLALVAHWGVSRLLASSFCKPNPA